MIIKPVRIGPHVVPGNVFLSPMAGYTDVVFRRICVRHGACATVSEMVSCEALNYGSLKTVDLLKRDPEEQYFGIQVFTSSPRHAHAAAAVVAARHPQFIDLNCGCPVPKIAGHGAGAALLRNPEQIGRIVAALIAGQDDAEEERIPVTVKLRLGWNAGEMTFMDAARAAVESGAEAVTLHPRTRSQGYSGYADWNKIAELKAAVDVPVFGSGDLRTPDDAARMLSETGCDGVMIARGAVGFPFIFRQIREYSGSGTFIVPSPFERVLAGMEHLEAGIVEFGERHACREMKKHLCAYTRGVPEGSELRNRFVHCQSAEDFREAFTAWKRNRQ